ncbi:MAG: hypothetical protein Q9160_006550 [Pyrenula sp. 1 TL-2023]
MSLQLNDLVGFMVALFAIQIARKGKSPKELTFGWQRAQLLGAFFNGVFLAALGLSIFLQSLERFISLVEVAQPKLVLIIGAIGLGLNILSALFLHGMSLSTRFPEDGLILDIKSMAMAMAMEVTATEAMVTQITVTETTVTKIINFPTPQSVLRTEKLLSMPLKPLIYPSMPRYVILSARIALGHG